MATKRETTDGKKEDKRKYNPGRPLTYKTVEELQAAIDQYFEDCRGEIVCDDYGEPKLTKWGQPIVMGAKPITVTGLALAIGLRSRQALLNYEGRKQFNDAILCAKLRCQEYAESRLFDRDGAMGAKFSLSNNFEGWSERQTIEQTTELSGKNGDAIKTESLVQVYIPDNGRDRKED